MIRVRLPVDPPPRSVETPLWGNGTGTTVPQGHRGGTSCGCYFALLRRCGMVLSVDIVKQCGKCEEFLLRRVKQHGCCRRLETGGSRKGWSSILLPSAKEHAMDTIIVEVHAAEGGDDAKLLVGEQLDIYSRYCQRRCL
jgi:hypothetical protein